MYSIRYAYGHVMVYDGTGRFLFSADSEQEARKELGRCGICGLTSAMTAPRYRGWQRLSGEEKYHSREAGADLEPNFGRTHRNLRQRPHRAGVHARGQVASFH